MGWEWIKFGKILDVLQRFGRTYAQKLDNWGNPRSKKGHDQNAVHIAETKFRSELLQNRVTMWENGYDQNADFFSSKEETRLKTHF